ncbi:DoxX family protein [Kribbella qitaiheensis]|uniref:DoxX family protein n=1 Tax=Kribbella qitaiheensis TaxID=1544730 RepID=UPI003619B1D8
MMYRILFAFLALGFAAGGVGTLLGVRFYTDILDRVGVGKRLGALISWLEIAAAAALIAGLFYPLAGIAAATGLAALMLGALLFHLRAKDYKGLPTPLILGILSAAAALIALPSV